MYCDLRQLLFSCFFLILYSPFCYGVKSIDFTAGGIVSGTLKAENTVNLTGYPLELAYHILLKNDNLGTLGLGLSGQVYTLGYEIGGTPILSWLSSGGIDCAFISTGTNWNIEMLIQLHPYSQLTSVSQSASDINDGSYVHQGVLVLEGSQGASAGLSLISLYKEGIFSKKRPLRAGLSTRYRMQQFSKKAEQYVTSRSYIRADAGTVHYTIEAISLMATLGIQF